MKNERDKVFSYALKLLSIRPRSSKELEERLLNKFPQAKEIVSRVMERVREMGYLDDREFARMWVEDRMRFHPRGREKVRRELRDKGVPEEVVEEVLGEVYPPEKEWEIMERLGRSKWERDAGVDVRKRKERVYRYLLYRGFPVSRIYELISSLE